jgi:hypothetical protein
VSGKGDAQISELLLSSDIHSLTIPSAPIRANVRRCRTRFGKTIR